jgi:hypothetical protein
MVYAWMRTTLLSAHQLLIGNMDTSIPAMLRHMHEYPTSFSIQPQKPSFGSLNF